MIRYLISVPPSGVVVTLAEGKAYLKKTTDDEDDEITEFIAAATDTAIGVMCRDILTTTWQGFNNTLFDDLTLRKGGFQSVESIDVLVDGSYVLVDASEYQVSTGGIFGDVCQINSQSHDVDCDAIRFTFKTGFGDTAADVPSNIKLAIKKIMANDYSNRGDCASDCSGGDGIPSSADRILKQYKIVNTPKFYHSVAIC